MSSDYLHGLALDLLAAAEDAISPDCTGHALPNRRYVNFGEPAIDLCVGDLGTDGSGQLVVWWSSITPSVQTRGSVCAVRMLGTICVQLARCVPDLDADGQPHAPEVYEEAAEFLHVDSWPLIRGVVGWVAGLGCAYKEVNAATPELGGGAASLRICATIELNDPDPICTL